VLLGFGDYIYELDQNWSVSMENYDFKEVSGVDVDADDNLYVFNRGIQQLLVVDSEGVFVKSWKHTWINPHGIHIDSEGNIFLIDRDSHVVLKYSNDEILQMTLGIYDQPSDTGYTLEDRVVRQAAGPFNRPAGRVAIDNTGDIFVADGYGNARVHRFRANGQHVSSWGSPGCGPGEFNLLHGVAIDTMGRLLVCDFNNDRIQVFDLDGHLLDIWEGLRRPTEVVIGLSGECYVAEYQHRISILDYQGRALSRWGDQSSHKPGQFIAPHGLSVDSQGDIYVAEVIEDSCPDCKGTCDARRLQKFVRQH